MEQGSDTIIEIEESSLNMTMNNTSKICANHGICSFPLVMINEKLLDM